MQKIFLKKNLVQFILLHFIFAPIAMSATVINGYIDTDNENVVFDLKYGATVDERREESFRLDTRECGVTPAPVNACSVKIIDSQSRYRYGVQNVHRLHFNLRAAGLSVQLYSKSNITFVADDQSKVMVSFPELTNSNSFSHSRLKMLKSIRVGGNEHFMGFHSLSKHKLFDQFLFAVSTSFTVSPPTDFVIAHQYETNEIAWKSKIDSGNVLNYVSSSPSEPYLIMGGRFSRGADSKSNLQLIDARTGELVRQFKGVESLDATSSYWVKNRVLITHSSKTDRTEGGDVVVDRGLIKGVITWHDLQTGELIKQVDSPLLEARAIEQSSDERQMVFAGFEGAAIVDVLSGKTLYKIHFADIYGPEYANCNNFGCGAPHDGFAEIDVSADRRLIALSRKAGPIIVIDTQTQKIIQNIEPKTPDGAKLFVRIMKMDPANSKLYVYGAEKAREPSIGHVLEYGLARGNLLHWYQGPEVLGESGGNHDSTVFSPDFKYLYSADSADGLADSRMLRDAFYRVFELE